MSNALITIKSLYESLSQTQRLLADYVLDHGEEIPFLSVHELAQLAEVSVATISRFARVIGYDSFKDFKTQLGKDSLASFDGIYQAIAPSDGDDSIIEKVFLGNIKSLEETLKLLNRNDLIRAAKLVSKARRIVFLGIGSSGNMAHDAALRFSQMDIQAEAYADAYQILIQVIRLKARDVVFGISHSGRSATTVKALELASSSGATTVGISNYMKSPLHEQSDVFLCTSFPESRVKVAALSSRIAQMCLIDALYLLVARYKKTSLRNMDRLNIQAEETLRLPAK
ncbi:MAG TPA: MurR/RpiR family transcriptional regulator [Hyphomicrobiaceae bacterium]|nr:MurR/RpiR family transcriptional regulator [Hyphomicrobiaceae bacterium]